MYLINKERGQHFLRVERGEELVEKVQEYCRANNITAGWVNGLGACDHAVISYYDLEKKEYIKHELEEEFELLSLIGNISVVDDKPFMHAHVTLGNRDKTVIGGHLHMMRISGTGEILITKFDAELTRSKDTTTGLSLLDGERF